VRFEDVVNDIVKLQNKKLNSIKPGAEITLLKVDQDKNRVELLTSRGKIETQPISKIKLIWEYICKHPAVHVESVLRGSGTSRNQPETILANLPYIEWFKFDKKKHLAFIGRPTHNLGTLRQMDAINAEKIKEQLRNSDKNSDSSTIIIISEDIGLTSKNIEMITGISIESIEPGVYQTTLNSNRVLLLASGVLPAQIGPGTFLVVQSTSIPEGSLQVQIAGQKLHIIAGGGVQFMVTNHSLLYQVKYEHSIAAESPARLI